LRLQLSESFAHWNVACAVLCGYVVLPEPSARRDLTQDNTFRQYPGDPSRMRLFRV